MHSGVPILAQWKRIWLGSMRTHIRTLASLSGLRIWCCRELWSQMQLWYCCGCGVGWQLQLWFDPSPGISICAGFSPKKKKINVASCSICLLCERKKQSLLALAYHIYFVGYFLFIITVIEYYIILIKLFFPTLIELKLTLEFPLWLSQ